MVRLLDLLEDLLLEFDIDKAVKPFDKKFWAKILTDSMFDEFTQDENGFYMDPIPEENKKKILHHIQSNLLPDIDPTPNLEYGRWIIQLYSKDDHYDWRNYRFGRFPEDLKRYIELKKEGLLKAGHKDILKFKSRDDFRDTIEEYEGVTSEKLERKARELARKESKVIYRDSKVLVVSPQTHSAACYYSQGAKWCTAMKASPGWFNDYVHGKEPEDEDDYVEEDDPLAAGGDLYIFLPKSGTEKWQLWVGNNWDPYSRWSPGAYDIDNDENIHFFNAPNNSVSILDTIHAHPYLLPPMKQILGDAVVDPKESLDPETKKLIDTWTPTMVSPEALNALYKNPDEVEAHHELFTEKFVEFWKKFGPLFQFAASEVDTSMVYQDLNIRRINGFYNVERGLDQLDTFFSNLHQFHEKEFPHYWLAWKGSDPEDYWFHPKHSGLSPGLANPKELSWSGIQYAVNQQKESAEPIAWVLKIPENRLKIGVKINVPHGLGRPAYEKSSRDAILALLNSKVPLTGLTQEFFDWAMARPDWKIFTWDELWKMYKDKKESFCGTLEPLLEKRFAVDPGQLAFGELE